MRRLLIVSWCCLFLSSLSSQAADDDDLARWQGTWKLVACTYNGEPQPGNVQWLVRGDHYNIRLDGRTGSDPYTFKLDPRQKRIDVFHHETPKGTWGGSFKGIYEITGDSLKVCYDERGRRYPQSFAAGRNSGQVLYVLKRMR